MSKTKKKKTSITIIDDYTEYANTCIIYIYIYIYTQYVIYLYILLIHNRIVTNLQFMSHPYKNTTLPTPPPKKNNGHLLFSTKKRKKCHPPF